MTTFFDTNVLLCLTVNQDLNKQKVADLLVVDAIKNNLFIVSPLVISEFIFVLSKLKELDNDMEYIDLFSKYANNSVDIDIVKKAYALCQKLGFCRSINDVIHLKFAEKFADKIVTFDADFEKLKPYTKLDIEILKV